METNVLYCVISRVIERLRLYVARATAFERSRERAAARTIYIYHTVLSSFHKYASARDKKAQRKICRVLVFLRSRKLLSSRMPIYPQSEWTRGHVSGSDAPCAKVPRAVSAEYQMMRASPFARLYCAVIYIY